MRKAETWYSRGPEKDSLRLEGGDVEEIRRHGYRPRRLLLGSRALTGSKSPALGQVLGGTPATCEIPPSARPSPV